MSKHPIKLTVFFCLCLLVVPGIANAQSKTIYLDFGEENIRILGDDTDDMSGFAVAKGDINGDGYDDIIIGGSSNETYVIFGSASPAATIDLNSVPVDMIIYDIGSLGNSVASGDINGDGYDDVIIGARMSGPAPGVGGGATYVIFGSSSPPGTIDLNSVSADMSIYGDDYGDYFGCSVSSGDINGDGYDDVIAGAFWAAPTVEREYAGETYVIFGSASPPSITNLNDRPSPAGMIIYGDDFEDYSGKSVSSGDINGDGYDDVIIGAYAADPESPVYRDGAGEAYVIFGSTSPSATIDLSSVSADMIIYGDWVYDYSAHSVSSGDINGDGYDDLIIGAPGADPAGGYEAGKTYVIFGSASPPSAINLYSSPADMTICGDDSGDQAGYSVSSGDINGDSYDDIIIGAPNYWLPQAGFGPGRSYVIYGDDSPPAVKDLQSESANITILGDDVLDFCGHSVAGGDINGDGYDDIIIGAPGADPAGGSKAGETYVIYSNDLPISLRVYDIKLIKKWPKIGGGVLIERDGKIILRQPIGFFQVFPQGALSDKCDIETKMIRRGGRNTTVSSSILFSYQDKKNYWEFKMLYMPIGVRRSEKLILRHKKNGAFVEKVVVKETISRRQQYLLHIEVRKDQIRVMVNDVLMIDLKPMEKPAWGNVVLGMQGDGAFIFEDLKIY